MSVILVSVFRNLFARFSTCSVSIGLSLVKYTKNKSKRDLRPHFFLMLAISLPGIMPYPVPSHLTNGTGFFIMQHFKKNKRLIPEKTIW